MKNKAIYHDKQIALRSLKKYLTIVIFTMITISLLLAICISIALAYFSLLPKVGADPIGFVLLIFAISIAVSSYIAYYINTRILRPIRTLSDASKTVATGDFTVRIEQRTDIEELNSTFDNFNNMVTELSSIETLRNDFVANVSHEFKTPLATIEGYTMLLQDESLTNEEKADYIKRITDNTRRLSSLTGDILMLSKLDNQTFSSEKKDFRLDEQLREAILTHETEWTQKEIDLDVDLEEIIFHGEENLLLQVWLNIIKNAIKFTPKKGQITVKLKRFNDFVEVSIADNGIGMDETTVKHIFEKFYQGDTSHKEDGNGLGLSLCKKIVDRFGGTIKAESELNHGSVFTVKLPI